MYFACRSINKCQPPNPCGPPTVIYATQGFPNRHVGCHASSTAPPPSNTTCQNIRKYAIITELCIMAPILKQTTFQCLMTNPDNFQAIVLLHSMIGSWNHNVVCPSVCPSAAQCIEALRVGVESYRSCTVVFLTHNFLLTSSDTAVRCIV